MGGFRGRAEGAAVRFSPRIYTKNNFNQPFFKRYCEIGVVLSPKIFRPPLSDFSASPSGRLCTTAPPPPTALISIMLRASEPR